MKIIIESDIGNGEINESLELSGIVDFEIIESIQKVKEEIIQVSKFVFLFYELQKNKNIKVNPDEELKKVLDSLNDDFEENVIY